MNNFKDIVDARDITDLEQLKELAICCDSFNLISKARQTEMYVFCKMHATYEVCRFNLLQMRTAITNQYFNVGF